MKIALVAADLDILGGQGVEAVLLCDALVADGHHVNFVPINPRPPRLLRWSRRVPYLRTVLNLCLYLPSLLQLARSDVVHVFSASYWSFLLAPLPAMLAGRAFGRRVVLHYHSGEADDHLARWGLLVHPWLRLAHAIVVPSQYLFDVFARSGYDTLVIPNIVDVSRFRFRQRHSFAPRLLSVRNLEPYYRVDLILEAFARVQETYPHASLVVAGCGTLDGSLRQLAARLALRNVRFAGRIEPEEMPRLFDDADIFVNASVLDNQPVSILEAFAAGTAVVSTPAGDIPAMVRDAETGRLVPADAIALAQAVADAIERPHTTRELALRARAELDRHTWPSVREAWTTVLSSSAAGPSLSPKVLAG